MSMNWSVYIGPYLTVPRDSGFDWMLWDSLVCDGRGESGVNEPNLILIPNSKLEGVERIMNIDCYAEHKISQINPATIVKESAAFSRLVTNIIKWFDSREIEIHEAWGVVSCWS